MGSLNESNGTTARQLVNAYTHLYYSETECNVISIILSILSVIGSASNICVLVVYLNKQSKCPFEIFVSFLALVNLIGSMLSMPLETVTVWSMGDETCNNPPDYMIVLTMVLECGSILSLLNIAIDRYFSICWPTHEVITEMRAKLLCAAVFLLSITLGIVLYATSNDSLEIHLIYSVSATFALLIIMLLYVLVFLKVKSSASNFQRNRTLASQRIAMDGAGSLQMTSSRKYKRRDNPASGSSSNRFTMPWKERHALTVEAVTPMDKRLSCSTVTADSAVGSESLQTLNGVYFPETTSQLTPLGAHNSDAEKNPQTPQTTHTTEHVLFETSLAANEVIEVPKGNNTLNEEHAQPDLPVRQCSNAPEPGQQKKPSMRKFKMSPFLLRRSTTTFERGLHDAMRSRTAKILTIITLCYILCFVPTSIINFIFYVRPNTLQSIPPGVIRLIKYTQLLYFLNFVLSPIVYSLFSEAFRNDCAALQRRLRRKFAS